MNILTERFHLFYFIDDRTEQLGSHRNELLIGMAFDTGIDYSLNCSRRTNEAAAKPSLIQNLNLIRNDP